MDARVELVEREFKNIKQSLIEISNLDKEDAIYVYKILTEMELETRNRMIEYVATFVKRKSTESFVDTFIERYLVKEEDQNKTLTFGLIYRSYVDVCRDLGISSEQIAGRKLFSKKLKEEHGYDVRKKSVNVVVMGVSFVK